MAAVQAEPASKLTARTRYDNLELYDIVRDVALVAVQRWNVEGVDLDPLLITQAQWDEAKPFSDFPDAPSAKQICERLKNYQGKPFPWRALIELVFDEDADIQQVEVARTRSPMLKKLNPDVVWYALRRLAGGEPTLSIHEYARRRDEKIARDPELEECFPTVGQILFLFGSWADALRHAGLEVRTEHYTSGRVSVNEAVLHFYRELGVLPTTKLLRAFAAGEGFALENIEHTPRWGEQLAGFRSFIVAQGLAEPPEYVPAQTNAAWSRWIKQKAEAVEAVTSASGGSPDGAGAAVTVPPNGSYRRKRFWRVKSEVLEKLQEFLASPLPAGQTKRTTQVYKRWAEEGLDRPSLDSVQKFGPLAKLLREARRPDAVEKAREQEAEAVTRAPAERVAKLHRKHVESVKGQGMLALLRDRGETTRAQLEAELGWPQRTVNTYLGWLIAAGAVEKLGDNDRQARYRKR